MLKFLADTLDYNDALIGIDKLSSDQLLVLLEKVKAQLGTKYIQHKEIKNTDITIKKELKEVGNKPTSVIECCLHCGSIHIKKSGKTKGGIQRYKCHDCGKTFSENYGLITHYTHLSEWQWLEVVRGIIVGNSITEIAKNIGTSTSTVWTCRLKIYQMIMNIYGYSDKLNGIVQADGKYIRVSFKGKRDKKWFIDTLGRLPRHHRSRAERIEYLGDDFMRLTIEKPELLDEMIYSSNKKLVGRDTIDINHQSVCVLSAIDSANNIYIEPVTSGTAKAPVINEHLSAKIDSQALLVTDDHNGYKYLTRKNHIKHVIVPSELHTIGGFNLASINSLHSAIDRYFGSKEYYPATKYLDLYLIMFWWLQKQKELNQSELVTRLFNIITGHVSNETRADMLRITTNDLVQRELPIDTNGLF